MTLAQFKGLKREAQRLAHETRGLTREQARHRVALQEGYVDWATLTRSIEVPLRKDVA